MHNSDFFKENLIVSERILMHSRAEWVKSVYIHTETRHKARQIECEGLSWWPTSNAHWAQIAILSGFMKGHTQRTCIIKR